MITKQLKTSLKKYRSVNYNRKKLVNNIQKSLSDKEVTEHIILYISREWFNENCVQCAKNVSEKLFSYNLALEMNISEELFSKSQFSLISKSQFLLIDIVLHEYLKNWVAHLRIELHYVRASIILKRDVNFTTGEHEVM